MAFLNLVQKVPLPFKEDYNLPQLKKRGYKKIMFYNKFWTIQNFPQAIAGFTMIWLHRHVLVI